MGKKIFLSVSLLEKRNFFLKTSQVKKALLDPTLFAFFKMLNTPEKEIAFLSVLFIQQEKYIFKSLFEKEHEKKEHRFFTLIDELMAIEAEYTSIGGIVGYHARALELIAKNRKNAEQEKKIESIQKPSIVKFTKQAVLAGILALPEMGELYPIGGLGDRLGLKDRFGIPLPVALLTFNKKNLLSCLVDDLEGREYLYYKLFNKKLITPIALMTSSEKDNHAHIKALLERENWYGRGRENFFLFTQPSAPVLNEKGNWVLSKAFALKTEPSGHGAIWKSALEKGVFEWFFAKKRTKALIRQINNPIGGIDDGLLALVGVGKLQNKALGFASCPRALAAAEGCFVLLHKKGKLTLSNIEYTDFDENTLKEGFPANTNMIYVDMKKVAPVIKKHPLPGLIMNMKGKQCGRLESMMQSLSDFFPAKQKEQLPTFLTYNKRDKTISVAKQKFFPEKPIFETPMGAFYTLLKNGHTLLKRECGVKCPPFSSPEGYLVNGPSLFFIYHPALGPLWEVIKQKIQGGKFQKNSELQLDITEVFLSQLNLNGSLLIQAESVLKGRCQLRNVKVCNKGINRDFTQNWWQNKIERKECCTIKLEGDSEFFAQNVTLQGNLTITIPHGQRWIAKAGKHQEIKWIKETIITHPSWRWKYAICEKNIYLEQEKRIMVGNTFHTLF